jgi:hypothetical protein
MKKKALIEQAKYATTEACVMCDTMVPVWRQPKSGGCKQCHVGKLIKMIKEHGRDNSK